MASCATLDCRVLLFDADGVDRVVTLDRQQLDALSGNKLAWMDARVQDTEQLEALLAPLRIDAGPVQRLLDHTNGPLFSQQAWFGARAIAPVWSDEHLHCTGVPWLLLVGPNIVVTLHKDPIGFLDDVAAHDDPASQVGQLVADSFAVALLDRMLTAWFDALDDFEDRVDRLEVDILKPKMRRAHLPELRKLRRAVAKFRRMLSAHRDLFDALARPDFRPEQDVKVEKQFRAIAMRYERAMDAVENARDLVVGSYELLSTRLSQRTNDTMRLLTFVTVMLGTLAVIAGVLGMNFHAGLFETGSTGFWTTVAAMAVFVVIAIVLARLRDWWK